MAITSTRRGFLSALGLAAGALAAPTAIAQGAGTPAATADAVARDYAAQVHAAYADTLASAAELQAAIRALLAQPSAATMAAARAAWVEAREFYGQTEAFRFYGGPIDDDKGPEGRLNSWPLDESYVDYVKGKPGAGIVGKRQVVISKASLAQLNERGGEENIAAGWHAIEFLLWGQDLSADGPGDRPVEDYIEGKGPNADRRRQYLSVVTELMLDDLRMLVTAWQPDARNYREQFQRGGMESIRKIIVGLGSLSRGELAGERMEVALNTQDQEDEHSCFSDNTHRDIVNNALGIENVWLARYQRRDGSLLQGVSLRALVATTDTALAERVTRQIGASVQAARAIQPPFDREIIGDRDAPGRLRIQKTIDSLVQQSKVLAEVATALGIKRLTLAKKK